MSNRKIQSLITKTTRSRGDTTEKKVVQALSSLRDEYDVPIELRSSSKLDKQGVDVEIKGNGVLHLWVGLDAKSSRSGVEEYRRKQDELIARGVKNVFPRFAFAYDRFNESDPQLLLDLFRFIIKKSKTHSEHIEHIPERAEELGQDANNEFSHHFRELISYILYELGPVYE